MNGMALGFYEETTNGHRIIGHAGDTQYLHSDLHLILDARVGLFLSYNSAGKSGTRAREAVRHAFLDRYCPYEPAPVSAVDGARDAQLVHHQPSLGNYHPQSADSLGWIESIYQCRRHHQP